MIFNMHGSKEKW